MGLILATFDGPALATAGAAFALTLPGLGEAGFGDAGLEDLEGLGDTGLSRLWNLPPRFRTSSSG